MKAALIIIGNEILSGRTKDKNLTYLAEWLNEIGIQLYEVRVIRDDEQEIIECVNLLKNKYDYVFTTGGIGPTHDDITTASIAKAFNVELETNTTALAILKSYYKEGELNEARLKMTLLPQGAELVENPVTKAPGFKMDNVFVMAGIPSIMQGMLEGARKFLQTGSKMASRSRDIFMPESHVANELSKLQDSYPDVEIGSYPFNKDGRFGTSLVMRSIDSNKLDLCSQDLELMLKKLT
ncbi:MAG: competence/damage-inducible protein A [Candidatus Pelagibacterales bacterium]|jgi:molybdenum cofactor synthesis domain-containing protein|tara:strand:+ start:528 stop:1241 length:714 start_codon:yes stop_codon:yes gene_type:complete